MILRIDAEIMKKYVEATKEDLALNNYVMRSKLLGVDYSRKCCLPVHLMIA